MALTVGDKAPSFSLEDDQGNTVTLDDYKGKNIIIYFYPKDNTPGCTQEACDFRDLNTPTSELAIIGVSRDSVQKHQKFKEKYALNFPLLADCHGDMCQAYGVINKKSLFGNTFLGIERSTFLIDKKGVIRNIWRKVKVKNHANEVLMEAVKL